MTSLLARGGAVAALVLALGLSGSASQEPSTLSLTARGPFPRGRLLAMQFQGEGKLPNRTVLIGSLTRHFEYWEVNKLKARPAGAGSFMSRLEGGRFTGNTDVPGPGIYTVKMELLDDNQNEEVRKAVRNLSPKHWSFSFHAFGDDLINQLDAKLGVLEELATEALAILKEFQEGSVQEGAWKTLEPQLEPRIKKLRTKAELSELRAYFPAALAEIQSTIEVVHQNLRYIVFKDGKFAGAKDYHAGDNQVKTHQNDPYAHENFRRYIEEAPGVAGREICLWIIKDFRRAGNQLRPEAAAIAKSLAKKPGIAEFAERLQALTADQLEGLEKAVRDAKIEAAPKKDK